MRSFVQVFAIGAIGAIGTLITFGCGPNDAVISLPQIDGSLDATHADGGDDIKQLLAINPSMVDFGFIAISAAGVPVTFTVKNIGDGTTGPLGIAVGGADMAHFAFAPGETCMPGTTVLKSGESCTVGVFFAPTTSGAKTALLTVTGDPGGIATSTLTGNGARPAEITITPSEKNFGAVAIGDQSLPSSFTVTNPGAAAGPLDIGFVGADATQFGFATGGTCISGSTILAGGSSCTILVHFAPTALGARLAGLTINATPGGTATATLTGGGSGAATLELSPSEQDFGAIALGDKSAPVSLTVTNPGATTSGSLDIGFLGADAAQFAITTGGTCVEGSSLAGGASCTILVRFAPTALGPRVTVLLVSATPGGTAAATLTGNGTGPAKLTVTPGTHDFGAIAVGDRSLPFSFTVTNAGAASGPLHLGFDGANATLFTLLPGGTCVDDATILSGGSFCTVLVEFAPTSLGAKTASLTVSATPGGTAAATLSGNGTGPAALTVSPGAKNFGTIAVGGVSALVSFIVTNTGDTATGLLDIALAGADATQFSFGAGGTCIAGATFLDGGASCKVNVRFAPTAEGAKSASLAISATPGGSTTATLTGTGSFVTNTLVISPMNMNYGTVPVGSLSARSFVVTNTGSAVTGKLQVTFGGADAADFLVAEGGTCVFGSTGILPEAACTVEVHFRPSTEGAKSATLILSATPGGVATATMTGSGLPPVTIVTTGFAHTCVTNGTNDRPGMAWCWGLNSSGQLGDGTLTNHGAPTLVPGIANVVEIAGGSEHTCARQADGSVFCWGANIFGQLGDGSTTNRSTPTLVPLLTGDVEELALGNNSVCARTFDGTVLCWGANEQGQLGNGSFTSRSQPTPVPGLTDVAQLACGYDATYSGGGYGGGYTCARKNNGTVLCWGDGNYGHLGVVPVAGSNASPIPIPDLVDVVGIATGGGHTCGWKSDGTLFCWGRNDYGQLGLSDTTQHSTPVLVPLSGVLQVALGRLSTCARATSGAVRCWGYNGSGQLGDGTTTNHSSPTPLTDLASVFDIEQGQDYACVLGPNMGVMCWGANNRGQLGDNSAASYRMTPVDVRWP